MVIYHVTENQSNKDFNLFNCQLNKLKQNITTILNNVPKSIHVKNVGRLDGLLALWDQKHKHNVTISFPLQFIINFLLPLPMLINMSLL